MFSVSINPTYMCNFNCDFCYLSKEQLNDRKTATLGVIMKRLEEIDVPITHVDLYGGEIGLLPDEYLNKLIDDIKAEYGCSISIITNLSAIREVFLRPDVDLSVSYDFDAREKEQLVFTNMLKLERKFSILTLASEKVISNDVGYMISAFNSLTNLIAVEIKPYSSTTHRNQQVTDKEFEEFIKAWIDNPIEKNWQFINQDKIEECLDGTYNAFSDDHVYITPSGRFAVLDFDNLGNEKFTELSSFAGYRDWADREKDRGVSDICKSCKYFGGCLTEHYKWVGVDPKINSCNGYFNLLEWYDEEPV
jgi:sulfatase maturation enzyme AslB (radical SAM superfamily)